MWNQVKDLWCQSGFCLVRRHTQLVCWVQNQVYHLYQIHQIPIMWRKKCHNTFSLFSKYLQYRKNENLLSGIKDKARAYLQFRLRQWGAGNVYLLVLTSWKVNIAKKNRCRNWVVCTPSPWLTQIGFTWISLTYIFKKFPFLT